MATRGKLVGGALGSRLSLQQSERRGEQQTHQHAQHRARIHLQRKQGRQQQQQQQLQTPGLGKQLRTRSAALGGSSSGPHPAIPPPSAPSPTAPPHRPCAHLPRRVPQHLLELALAQGVPALQQLARHHVEHLGLQARMAPHPHRVVHHNHAAGWGERGGGGGFDRYGEEPRCSPR